MSKCLIKINLELMETLMLETSNNILSTAKKDSLLTTITIKIIILITILFPLTHSDQGYIPMLNIKSTNILIPKGNFIATLINISKIQTINLLIWILERLPLKIFSPILEQDH